MSGTDAQIKAAAVQDIATNLGGTASGMTVTVGSTVATVDVHYPPSQGAYVGNARAIEVTLTQPQNVLMTRLWRSSQNIQVRAVALQSSAPGSACILSLKPGSVGINDTGTPNLTLNGCGVAANSSDDSSSMTAKGTAKVKADWVHLSGDC